MDEQAMRESIVRTARMMASAGLAGAFGHVSTRWCDGFAITSTRPFTHAGSEDVVLVHDLDDPPSGGGGVPLETPMHAAIYVNRPDVGAICRGHPSAVVALGVGVADIPLLHGLGAIAGQRIAVHPDVDLIHTLAQGAEVAETLKDEHGVVLRTNGCFAVGATQLEALTRLYYMEERAAVALNKPVDVSPVDWNERLRHTSTELTRAMEWVEVTFGDSTNRGQTDDADKQREKE